MKFNKEQLEILKNCHKDANCPAVIREAEEKFENGWPFDVLVSYVEKALTTRLSLPWIVAQQQRRDEIIKLLSNVDASDEIIKAADHIMMQGYTARQAVDLVRREKSIKEGKPWPLAQR